MSTLNRKPTTLLKLWTWRYVLTLCIGLLMIGLLTTLWIRHAATEKRLDMINYMAEEIKEQVVDYNGHLRIDSFIKNKLEERQRFLHSEEPTFFILFNKNGQIVSHNRMPFKNSPQEMKWIGQTLKMKKEIGKIELEDGEDLYIVKKQIRYNGSLLGWIILLQPEKTITKSPEEIQLLFVMLTTIGVLGWAIMYLLTKKLTKPIQEVANAANEIVKGNYDVHLPERRMDEQELYDLITSFKEMTHKLRQLESMRSELFAGVTHELKTPITSVSGLIQAVKEGVVEGEEAEEFLNLSLLEIKNMQKMIEDLLNFNSFSIGNMHVQKEKVELNETIQQIMNQWSRIPENESVTLLLKESGSTNELYMDGLRLQQILINLFNNAKNACEKNPHIQVTVVEEATKYSIYVSDNGQGIPKEEQAFIFDKYFRGRTKKFKTRGLGLGLSFSKLLAKNLDGDLVLEQSSPNGTVFVLTLPK